jgi:2-methylcitrate dehydratase PrpD
VPTSSYAAQFSLPYGVACCLARGHFGLEELEQPAYTDPQLLALSQKVTYEIDPNSGFPKFRSGEVIVRTRNGRRYAQRESILPDEPAGADEIIEKFMMNATSAIPAARAERIRDMVMHLESQTSARELMAHLGKE